MNLAGPDRRALLALVAAVSALHLLVLQASPQAFQLAATSALAKPLITRTIVIRPPPLDLEAARTPAPPIRRHMRAVERVAQAAPTVAGVDAASPPAELPAPLQDAALPAPAPIPPLPSPAAPVAARSATFAIPGSVRLRYKIEAQARSQFWQANGTLDWRHDGSDYEASLEVYAGPLRSRTQRSVGRITGEGLAPTRFSDKSRSEEATHFQREQGKVSFSSNRPDAPLSPGAQDRLSVILQLAALVAGDAKKFPAGTAISIQTASTREAEVWQFTVEGEEQLQLPGGAVSALKLTRIPRREFDQKVELWLAPGMDYVPVRLRLTQPNGDWVDQQWSSTDRG